MMLRTMERMMERLFVYGIPPPRENQEKQHINQNSTRPQISQNRKRDQRIPPDPHVRPQFQENYVDQKGGIQAKDEIH